LTFLCKRAVSARRRHVQMPVSAPPCSGAPILKIGVSTGIGRVTGFFPNAEVLREPRRSSAIFAVLLTMIPPSVALSPCQCGRSHQSPV
jgi:hypothetical protein